MGLKTERARELRRNSTDAEWKLWQALRSRQTLGLKWRRQMPIDRYFADFGCKDARLVVELDGDQHDEQQAYDAARTQVIERCGYHVMRFGNHEVLTNTDGVLEAIAAQVRLARGAPSPSQSLRDWAPPSPVTGRGVEGAHDD
jgi:very-short-patch-repair endonuclease